MPKLKKISRSPVLHKIEGIEATEASEAKGAAQLVTVHPPIQGTVSGRNGRSF